jgi:F0F1-type ATP synthase alpha subunit
MYHVHLVAKPGRLGRERVSANLSNAAIRPAINVGISVSRVGSSDPHLKLNA